MRIALLLGLPALIWGHPQRMMMMDNRAPASFQSGQEWPAPRYVEQRLDHFSSANGPAMWNQAYYVNDTFWKPGSDAPIFLCVGGEGPPMEGSAVVKSAHCNNAVEWLPEKNALMFAIEHRYYGCHNMSACPVSNFNDQGEALKYLSSSQAIEDVASFIQQMNSLYKLTKSNKWVTWGGSYPGILAGWSRLKHPELIHAAVASSAPVHAKLDMSEYNNWVAYAYTVSDDDVGGSKSCSDAIRKGHASIEASLESGAIHQIEEKLGLAAGALKTKEQQMDILGNGLAYFPAQANDPACTEAACNIKKICAIMVNSSYGNELERLLALRRIQAQSTMLLLKSDRVGRRLSDLPDFWFYQTCTEFGFYQSCEHNSSCMYVRGLVTVESMDSECENYGINAADIIKSIDRTNNHHGALMPTGPTGNLGSCVLWPNGNVDPWASLGVLKSPSKQQPTLMVPGASHHAWTHPSEPTDQPSVVAARGAIRTVVNDFLSTDCVESERQRPEALVV